MIKSPERYAAKQAGHTTYFTGDPCLRGHVAPRQTVNRKCTECRREEDRRWHHENKEESRRLSRERHRARLPAPTRPEPSNCELCGGPPTARSLHLDHDHTTGRFRGWLCHYCNTNLGRFGDSVEGLRRAIDYLTRNAT
jgi:hypothetical protein